MPTANNELRADMERYFGSIDLHGPLQFLKNSDWREEKGFLLTMKPPQEISRKEWDCVNFLIQEWDFDYGDTWWERRTCKAPQT